jgi:AraC-like DNA-binding protein
MDPKIELAPLFADTIEPTVVPFSNAVVARWRRTLGDARAPEALRMEAWIRSELLRDSPPRRIHPAVKRALDHMGKYGLDRRNVSLVRLAEVGELSTSRFMHVFTESVGIPLRPYLLWLRVQRAAGALASGSTATKAAYLAGFADAPHMTRTFRRMLGMAPRDLVRRTQRSGEVRLASVARQPDHSRRIFARSLP